MAVYFFHGEEDFNIEHDIEELKKTLDKNFIEMSFKVYDNPKYAVVVMKEHGKSGSQDCCPIFRTIVEKLMNM